MVRVSIDRLDRPGRDTVSGLVIGYEADARNGITMEDQARMIGRWRRMGWSDMVYHCHVLAILIAYGKVAARG